MDEEDDSFWSRVLLGSQVADGEKSPTASVRSMDTHTATELRAIHLISNCVEVSFPRPTPPPGPAQPRTLVFGLPVLTSRLLSKNLPLKCHTT